MRDERTQFSPVPESRALSRRRTRLSLVWVVPIVAALVGAWVAVTRIESEGPKITIVFGSAEGLEAGKTKIEYKGVEVGTITSIQLAPDHRQILAAAEMAPKTEDFLVEHTQFWVVRPRISGANVTGLGTLISGAYIGMEIGSSKRKKRDFVTLETPPVVTGGAPGRFFVLETPNLGLLDIGTPVLFRRLQVGEVDPMCSTRTAAALPSRSSSRLRTTSMYARTRASGRPAESTCSSRPAALACRHSRCCPF